MGAIKVPTATNAKAAKHTKVNECETVEWHSRTWAYSTKASTVCKTGTSRKKALLFLWLFLAVRWHAPWRKMHCLISFFSFWSCTCQEVQKAPSNFALVTNVNTYLKLLIRAPASCLDTRFRLHIWQPKYYAFNDRNLIKQTSSYTVKSRTC